MSVATLPEPIVLAYSYEYGVYLAEALTPREMDVLRLMMDGLGNKEIGEALGLHWMTARTHVYNILQKLGARNRTHAVTIAFRAGLIEMQEPVTVTFENAVTLAAHYSTLAQRLLTEEA